MLFLFSTSILSHNYRVKSLACFRVFKQNTQKIQVMLILNTFQRKEKLFRTDRSVKVRFRNSINRFESWIPRFEVGILQSLIEMERERERGKERGGEGGK